MKLHEYQARDILQRYGIPVTGGGVASHARRSAPDLPNRSAAESRSRRRCRSAGAARPAASSWPITPDEAEEVARQILGMDIKGLTVEKVLVAEAITYENEIYLVADPGPRHQAHRDDRLVRRRRRDRRGRQDQSRGDHEDRGRPDAGPAGLPGARAGLRASA